MRSATQLRDDAVAIWQAGVDAVDSQRLVAAAVSADEEGFQIAGQRFSADQIERIVVVGGGKAGAGMARGLEQSLGRWRSRITGSLNVPADCVAGSPPIPQQIQLVAARPAGVNEPTAAGVTATEAMLDMAAQATERDLCICLLSGGGSALMPLPLEGVTLEDKQRVTRFLSGAGANIAELNTVRKQLSRFKGGGLARACRAGWLLTLVISDVIGDPLDVIASGPTVPDRSTPADALAILERIGAFHTDGGPVRPELRDILKAKRSAGPTQCRTLECIVGNNRVAVEAAEREAARRGYRVRGEPAAALEGEAETVGAKLAHRLTRMREGRLEYDCLISGGEPTVQLADPEIRGLGGRNTQLAAAALKELASRGGVARMALLSGGTDGEDGPTDAAGAWIGAALDAYQADDLDRALECNDTYRFFEACGGLIQTGPTHTNVCDLRVAVVSRET